MVLLGEVCDEVEKDVMTVEEEDDEEEGKKEEGMRKVTLERFEELMERKRNLESEDEGGRGGDALVWDFDTDLVV